MKIIDGELYTIAQLSEMFGIKDVTLRQRFRRDKPEYVLKNGVMHFTAEVARKLIQFRKKGRVT